MEELGFEPGTHVFHAWLWATQSGASGSNNHLQFMKGAQPLVPPQVHWVRIYILTKSLMTHGQTEVQGVRAEASLDFCTFLGIRFTGGH